jgi:putative ABC transport system substrate-binding protein
MSDRIGRHRRAPVRLALTTLAVLAFVASAVADEAEKSKWFRYDSSINSAWEIAGDPAQPMRVSIRRKNALRLSSPQHVLVLYPRASSAYDIAITKILEIFDAKDLNVDLTVINFELDDAKAKESVRFAETNRINLIFAMGSESTAWLYNHYRGGSIPVVSVCSKDPVQLGQAKNYERGSDSNFAFTSLNMQVDVQMAYVRELKPDLKNLAVLVDANNVSAVQTQAEPIAAYAGQKGINVIWGTVQNPEKAREELVHIIRGSVEAMRRTDPDLSKSLFWVTGSTSVFREIRTINENSDRVPVVSVVPEIVTMGGETAVLAIGISFESNAHLAAVYGAEILAGIAKVGELKVGIVSPPDIAISFLKAREIGLRIPFEFFESASFVYDYQGQPVRKVENKISLH